MGFGYAQATLFFMGKMQKSETPWMDRNAPSLVWEGNSSNNAKL